MTPGRLQVTLFLGDRGQVVGPGEAVRVQGGCVAIAGRGSGHQGIGMVDFTQVAVGIGQLGELAPPAGRLQSIPPLLDLKSHRLLDLRQVRMGDPLQLGQGLAAATQGEQQGHGDQQVDSRSNHGESSGTRPAPRRRSD